MKHWYYAHEGQRKGPVDAATIQNLYWQGQIRPDDLVWEEGMGDWVKASSVLPPPNLTTEPQVPPSLASPPPMAAQRQESVLAIVSLVSGIISLPGIFCCGLLGLIPVITGHLALAEIKRNSTLPGKGMAQAGLIMGYITLGITLLFILVYVGILVLAAISGAK